MKIKEERQRYLLEEAMEKGEQKKLISLIQKKLEKGYSPERIAEELEEDTEMVRQMITDMR